MKTFMTLAARNIKMFFKDKGLFLVSMITPIILLVLYVTFLADVYRDGIAGGMPEGFAMPDKVIGGLVSGEVASSMLAVICVTVSFCSNMVMVQDKISGASKDLSVTPVKKSLVALSYFAATLAVTLIICIAAMLVCFIYVGASGWFLSAGDVFLIILDIILLTLFGTALSSIINCFISTQGQSSAVGTIVSAGYGFFCGAYMPISSMGSGLQKVFGLLPGTYGTSLVRNHFLQGPLQEVQKLGAPPQLIEGIKDSVDCNLYFFGAKVSVAASYIVLALTVIVLIGVYVLVAYLTGKKRAPLIRRAGKKQNKNAD